MKLSRMLLLLRSQGHSRVEVMFAMHCDAGNTRLVLMSLGQGAIMAVVR